MTIEFDASTAVLLAFFKALADESRLRLVGLLAHSERSVDELATLLDLRAPTVSHHLSRLKTLGLVEMRPEGTTHVYSLNTDVLRSLGKQALSPEALNAAAVYSAEPRTTDAWERKVLRDFFIGQTLKEIPAARKKRDVILRWLADRFADGQRYPEGEVNTIIAQHHPDVATLRRELIGAGLLAREHNVYWRPLCTKS